MDELNIGVLYDEKDNKKEKKSKKKEKKLDKELNSELESKVVFKKVEDNKVSRTSKNEAKNNKNENKKHGVIAFLYDTLFGFITILLFITSVGCLGYTFYKKLGVNDLLVASLLAVTGLFYMLSMFTKSENAKKIFSIITSIALMIFMAIQLFLI